MPESNEDKLRAKKTNFRIGLALACTVLVVTLFVLVEKLNSPKDELPQVTQPHLKLASLPSNFKPESSASIYVPIYSTISYENRLRTIDLAATLSVRNTDLKQSIILRNVDYYGTAGQLIKKYLSEPVELLPMSSADFVVDRTDVRGGVGANFVVDWMAAKKVTLPIAEAVMVSTGSSHSISFVSRGVTVVTPEKQAEENN